MEDPKLDIKKWNIKYTTFDIPDEFVKAWMFGRPEYRKFYKCLRIIMTVLTRIFYFVPFLIVRIFWLTKQLIFSMVDYIIYGGEVVTYNKVHNHKSITETYIKVNKFINEEKTKQQS